MNENRDFKGIWIPKEIWLDTRLTALDKIILAEIDSLDNEDGCWASNDYIAEFCQCSRAKVTASVSKLISLGFITVASFDGRKRVLRSRLLKNSRQTTKKYEADSEKIEAINIKNNIKNNITDRFKKPSVEDVKEYCKERSNRYIWY